MIARIYRGALRACAFVLAAAMAASPAWASSATTIRPLETLKLPDGRSAVVYSNGRVELYSKDRRQIEFRRLLAGSRLKDVVANPGLPDKRRLIAELMLPHPHLPYVPGRAIVVFRSGTGAPQSVFSLSGATVAALRKHAVAAPAYTRDLRTNRILASLGTIRVERLFRDVNGSQLDAMRANAQARLGRPLLDIAAAYRLQITGASVRDAVTQLLKLPTVAYASPDWRVTTMHATPIPISAAGVRAARLQAERMRERSGFEDATARLRAQYVPSNYALSSSLQSLHNAPGADSAAAFDEIWTKYHQLPGTGETIANVSLGDLDDASAAANANDPCWLYAFADGPTTEIVGGQRYVNWPSMPLIPAYTADDNGTLDGKGEVCNVDPLLDEVGLDFSMMAPLPDEDQRAGEQGSGLTDLLGIAPGATYRLIVPASSDPTYTDIQGALLGAALQTPRPNVITASLGYGLDAQGFSGRFLEDDPLTEAIVAAIVNSLDIVVCIAAGDGIRPETDTAIGPSGGTTPTEVAKPGAAITSLADVGFSGYPSHDYDSGSIDVGGTTLDDIFSDPPQYATNAVAQAQHAYPETRFSGAGTFSSGDGTRVDVSAPSDNVVALEHAVGGADDAVTAVINGGTSAAAPETAAAAAVVMQVARLSGHPFTSAAAVRAFLTQTGTAVPANGQTDAALHVGPQIDVRRAVETLLAKAGAEGKPAVHRVAVEQRRDEGGFDGTFQSDTDPGNIDLQSNNDANVLSWITIAPDWEWMPAGATYRLTLAAKPSVVLATTPWARLLPATILTKAGFTLASPSSRTVKLVYRATLGRKTLASAAVALTFGPADSTAISALAPKVPAVVTGSTIPVRYDISKVDDVSNPEIFISYPGRFNPAYFGPFNFQTIPLTTLKGTVRIPVSSLHGGGIYGIGIEFNTATQASTDIAFVRVAPSTATAQKPLPPLLSIPGSPGGHDLEIPYGTPFRVSWNVASVSGATGAIVEISAPGPTLSGIYNPFNNPEGSIPDRDGVDTGSIYTLAVNGRSGSTTIDPKAVGLSATFDHTVRVIPMKFGAPAGEASDASTVEEDGLRALDGGFVYPGGFGVNANGVDGFLTSWQFLGPSESPTSIATSMDTIDTTTEKAVTTIASQVSATCCSSPSLLYRTLGGGIFGSDVGLYELFDQSSNSRTFGIIDPVAGGQLGASWTPPYPSGFELQGAAWNQTNATAAFYGLQPALGRGRPTWDLFTSDLAANTFGTTYDITGAIGSESSPEYQAIAENPNTNQAWLASLDGFSSCGTPTLVDVDLGSGNTSSFTGVGSGTPESMAIDPTTNTAAVTTGCDGGLGIYNLGAQTGVNTILPGAQPAFYLAADPANHLFLMAQLYPPDQLTNANALSHLLVYDENGNLVKDENGFQWAFLGIYAGLDGVQISPATRSGLTFGPDQSQLQPFTY